MRQFCLYCDKELPEPKQQFENYHCDTCDIWYQAELHTVALGNPEPKPGRFKEFQLGEPFYICILFWVGPDNPPD